MLKSLQLCATLCDPMNCSLPGSFVHGIFQARIMEWVAIPSSRGSSWPRDRKSSLLCLLHCRQILYRWPIGEVHLMLITRFKNERLSVQWGSSLTDMPSSNLSIQFPTLQSFEYHLSDFCHICMPIILLSTGFFFLNLSMFSKVILKEIFI